MKKYIYNGKQPLNVTLSKVSLTLQPGCDFNFEPKDNAYFNKLLQKGVVSEKVIGEGEEG